MVSKYTNLSSVHCTYDGANGIENILIFKFGVSVPCAIVRSSNDKAI